MTDHDIPTLEDLHGAYARDDLEPGEIMAMVREWRRQDLEREEAQYRRVRERLERDDAGDGQT